MPFELHYARGQRHRCRRPDPFVARIVHRVQTLIDSTASLHIRADHMEFHRVGLEGRLVETVDIFRNVMIGILRTEEVARQQQRTQRTIAPILGKRLVIPDGPSCLPRLVVTAEGSTRRHPYGTVEGDAGLHHHIHHAGREKASEGASFKNQSCFHIAKIQKKTAFLLSFCNLFITFASNNTKVTK